MKELAGRPGFPVSGEVTYYRPVIRIFSGLFYVVALTLALVACGGNMSTRVAAEPVAGMARTWVFAAGISRYKDNRFSLKYADEDAKAIADLFTSAEGSYLQDGRAIRLLNEEATRENILTSIEEIAKRSDDEDRIVIFLAMHATSAPGEPFYFLAHNTDPAHLLATGISEDELKRALAKARAKQVIWLLDTCHAGSFGFSDFGGKRAVRADETERLLTSLSTLSEQGTGVLAAAEKSEYSEEDERWGGGHGVFTYHMLRGLRGEADEDKNGTITLREIFDYIYPLVKKDRAGQQHPVIMGEGRLALVQAASAALPVAPVGVVSSVKECPPGMAFVPRGEFWMGSADSETDADADERPRHRVRLDAYCLDKTEVTASAFKRCTTIAQHGVKCESAEVGVFCTGDVQATEEHPINCVDWTQADTYCKWAGKRLPTEAEWEKAARGGDERKYPWGNERPNKTKLNACGEECYDGFGHMYNEDDGYGMTAPVGAFSAGPYGLFDMAGNVREWMADWYAPYEASFAVNPGGPNKVPPTWSRVIRGGGWGDSDASRVRVVSRSNFRMSFRFQDVGFRCAREPIP